jgi:hypothetical protein
MGRFQSPISGPTADVEQIDRNADAGKVSEGWIGDASSKPPRNLSGF